MKTCAPIFVLACSLCFLNACGGDSASPTNSVPQPTVTISSSSSAVTVGQSVTLTWSSTHATSCTASATPSESDWSGSVPMSGSQNVVPLSTGTITYALQCAGTGGSAAGSAAVTGNPAAALVITS